MRLGDWLSAAVPVGDLIIGGSCPLDEEGPLGTNPTVHPLGMCSRSYPYLPSKDPWDAVWRRSAMPLTNRSAPDTTIDGTNKQGLAVAASRGWTTKWLDGRRERYLACLRSKPFIGVCEDLAADKYFAALTSHKFTLSPRGAELDTHRTYEAIVCKCVPLLDRIGTESAMELRKKYEGLPVVFEVDYETLSREWLEDKWLAMLEVEYDFERLRYSYWTKRSKNLERNMRYWCQACEWGTCGELGLTLGACRLLRTMVEEEHAVLEWGDTWKRCPLLPLAKVLASVEPKSEKCQMTVKDERKRQGRVLDCCDVSELAMVFDRVLLSGREAKSRTSQLIERELIHRDSLVFVHNWDEERDGSVLDHYELLLETPPIVTHRQGVTTGIAVLRPRADIGASLGEGRPS